MSAIWRNHADRLIEMLDNNNDTHAHLFLEQLMLLPVDIQDKIIHDVGKLRQCNCNNVAHIISEYSMFELR